MAKYRINARAYLETKRGSELVLPGAIVDMPDPLPETWRRKLPSWADKVDDSTPIADGDREGFDKSREAVARAMSGGAFDVAVDAALAKARSTHR